jgi:hypothetical protein
MESERDRRIRERAYELWVAGGRQEGGAEQDWERAEREIAGGQTSVSGSAAKKRAAGNASAAATAGSEPAKASRSTKAAANGAAAEPAKARSASKAKTPDVPPPAKAPGRPRGAAKA